MRMILCRIGLILGFFFFFSGSLLCQELIPRFKTYSNRDGLSQSVVISIFQDSKNFLWFGTEDGLNKFDGYNFKIYRSDPEDSSSISDNWIGKILMEDRDGEIWIITGDRLLNCHNPRNESFRKLIPSETNKKCLLPSQWLLLFYQDTKGYFWISTERGLFRLNKKTWEVQPVFVNSKSDDHRHFRYVFEDENNNLWFGSNQGILVWSNKENKIKGNYFSTNKGNQELIKVIYGIKSDPEKNIWAFTGDEILLYNKNTQKFDGFSYKEFLKPEDKSSKGQKVKALFAFVEKDKNNIFWICTQRGLVRFNPKTKELKAFLNRSSDKSSISHDFISSFFEDKQGRLWFGTANGLNRFNPSSENFSRIETLIGPSSSSFIDAILEDKLGNIWTMNRISQSDGYSLNYLNIKSQKLVQIESNPQDMNSVLANVFYDSYIDKQGGFWVGSFGGGVSRYAPFQKKFELIANQPGNDNSIDGNSSWAISEDPQGKLWLALYQGGLDCLDPVTGKIIHYRKKIESFLKAQNLTYLSVVCDKYNHSWVGVVGFGVISVDVNTGAVKHYQNIPGDSSSLSANSMLSMTSDHKGNILITYGDKGFDVLDPKTGRVKNYSNIQGNKNSLFNNTVRYMIETSDGNYWISHDGVIDFMDNSSHKVTHYISRSKGGNGINAEKASCIFEDSRKNIWVGTHGGGLALFDPKKKNFKFWTEKNGLVNNVIYGILEDKNHQLWLSTNNGLSCFDQVTEKFTNYYANDGLQGSEFNSNAFYKSKSGKMYFGGIYGITSFIPEDIKPDLVPTRTIITGLQIFNKKVEVLPFSKKNLLTDYSSKTIIVDGSHLYSHENISYTDELVLNYQYKVFTFEFAALCFDMPERCTFMYKMEGFEDDWNLAGNRRYATYTNLPPGSYVFKVTAANADGIWNPEPVKIRVIIKPPFYLTWWFISIEVMIVILLASTFIQAREKKLKRDKTKLEHKVKLRTQELNNKNEELVIRNIQIIKQKEEIAFQAKQLQVEMENQNQTSEIALLRSQVNPHFLFNTLNNIYSLVYQRSTEAPAAVMKLSDIMRYMLYDATTDRVQLEKEINYLKSFIELQQLRLKHKDFVLFEITGDPMGKVIAPMLLIPFIENAFKHGNKSVPSPGIIIQLNSAPGLLTFDVKNKKAFSSMKDSSGGIGLQNVKRRLALIYPGKYELNMIDNDEMFSIHLTISE
jgi:ligand-binding sensor domain-containing protein